MQPMCYPEVMLDFKVDAETKLMLSQKTSFACAERTVKDMSASPLPLRGALKRRSKAQVRSFGARRRVSEAV